MKNKLIISATGLALAFIGLAPAHASVTVPTFTVSSGVAPGSGSAITSSSVILAGTKNLGDTLAYTIAVQTGSSTPTLITFAPSASATTWSKTVVGLTGGTTYSFTVTATDTTSGDYAVSQAATFAAQSVPDVPTALTAVSVKNGINLGWTPPGNTGGVPLTGYTLADNKGDSPISIPGTATSYAVTGLSAGAALTYTLTANNIVGSASVVSFNPTTVSSVPGAPDQPTATASGSDITVTWSAPAITGGSAVTGYSVTLTSSTGATDADSPYISTQPTPTTYTFHSVPAGSWTATVAATNGIGTGLPSAASSAIVIAGSSSSNSTSTTSNSSSSGTSSSSSSSSTSSSTSTSTTTSSNSTSNSSGGGSTYVPPAPPVVVVPPKADSNTAPLAPTPTPQTTPPPVTSTTTPSPNPPSSTVVQVPTDNGSPAVSLPVVTKVLATGITEYSNKVTAGESTSVVSKPATSITSAPLVAVVAGKPVATNVKALPKSQAIAASIVIAGKSVSLGSFKTTSSGSLELPGLNLKKPGTYIVALKTSKGTTYFVKLVVKAKK